MHPIPSFFFFFFSFFLLLLLLLFFLLLLRSCMNDPYLRSLDIRRALLGWAAPQPWTSPGAEVCPVCVLDAKHRLKAMGERVYAAPPMATELTPFFPPPSASSGSDAAKSGTRPWREGRKHRVGSRAMEGSRALPVARRSPLKRERRGDSCGCDHTSVNAPDPIRTPQLSALGLE